jgi:hypothetical protein
LNKTPFAKRKLELLNREHMDVFNT